VNEVNKKLAPTSILEKLKVLFIALGSMTSQIAIDLTRTGIGTLTFVDPDTVTEQNLVRAMFFYNQIGMYKVDAGAAHAKAINPAVQVETYPSRFEELEGAEAEELIASHDLIIVGTDSPACNGYVNAKAYKHKPVIYCGVYDGANAGDVLVTIPQKSPCYKCVIGHLAELTPRGPMDYTKPGERIQSLPGLLIDIRNVAGKAARIGLELLLKDVKGVTLPRAWNIEHHLLFVGNAPGQEPFTEAFQCFPAICEREEACSICGTQSNNS